MNGIPFQPTSGRRVVFILGAHISIDLERALHQNNPSVLFEASSRRLSWARNTFEEHRENVALVVVGGPRLYPELTIADMITFIREVRAGGFTRCMIAANPKYNDDFLKAGCCTASTRGELPEVVDDRLNPRLLKLP